MGKKSTDSKLKLNSAEASKKSKKKAKKEDVRSVRNKKKNHALRNLLQNFPRQSVHEPTETELPTGDSESDAESVYQSRKLLMRQMVHQHLKNGGETSESEADSWTDIENRFAMIYEPIPLSVSMEKWRSMSKEQIMENIQSQRMRTEFRYKSRSEILERIESLKRNAVRGDNRNPRRSDTSVLYEEIPVTFPRRSQDSAGDRRSETYASASVAQALRGQSLSDIFQAKLRARHQVESQRTNDRNSGKYVTRALVHRDPHDYGTADESYWEQPNESQSRLRIMGNIESRKQGTRPDITEKVRQRKSSLSSDIRSLDGDTTAADASDRWDCSSSCVSCSECDDCSLCSCCSCESVQTVVTARDRGKRSAECELSTPEPVALSEIKQRKKEIERLRIMEEQEKRLRELVRQSTSSDLKSRPSTFEKQRYGSSGFSELDEPATSARSKKGKRSEEDKQFQRRIQLLLLLKTKLKESLAAEGDRHLLELKHQELKELLKEVIDSESDTLSNVNLGLMYVPTDEKGKSDRFQTQEPIYEYDTFGSIDSLLFQPKAPSTEDILEVEEEVDEHFQYLDNEEYGYCSESMVPSGVFSSLDQKIEHVRPLNNISDKEKSLVVRNMSLATSPESEHGMRDSENYTAIDTDASWDYIDTNADPKGASRKNFYHDSSSYSESSVWVGRAAATETAAVLLEHLSLSDIEIVDHGTDGTRGSVTSFARIASEAESCSENEEIHEELVRNESSVSSAPEGRVANSNNAPSLHSEFQIYSSNQGESLYGSRNAGILLTEYAKKNTTCESIPESVVKENQRLKLECLGAKEDETQSLAPEADVKESPETTVEPVAVLPRPGPVKLFGLPKSDTMIRELKLKLKQRFQVESDAESETTHAASARMKEIADLSTDGASTVALKKELLAPKLSKIFGSLMLNPSERRAPPKLNDSFVPQPQKTAGSGDKGSAIGPPTFPTPSSRLENTPPKPGGSFPGGQDASQGTFGTEKLPGTIDPSCLVSWYQHPELSQAYSVNESKPWDSPRTNGKDSGIVRRSKMDSTSSFVSNSESEKYSEGRLVRPGGHVARPWEDRRVSSGRQAPNDKSSDLEEHEEKMRRMLLWIHHN